MGETLLEVCVDSYASAMAAIRGGADRLELCSALPLGGLTPWAALLVQIRRQSNIPIRCLMRPRPGDFLYCEDELDLLCAQIIQLHRYGASGFVLGVLTAGGELDVAAMRRLIGATGGAPVTLHRAIDVSCNALQTYEAAARLGVDAVLTSGQAASCENGLETITQLLARRGETNGPEVLIGAGVTPEAIRRIRLQLPTSRAFHMSAKTTVESGMYFRRSGVPMGASGFDEWQLQYASESIVREAKAVLSTPVREL